MDEWQQRVDAVWASAAEHSDEEVLLAIDALVAERPVDDAAALFQSASVRDYAGLEAAAEPRYRAALAAGLPEPDRGRAVIQLASTLRNLGRFDEAIAVLEPLLGLEPRHPLADAAWAFLALTLASRGDDRTATAVALRALARHLPEYGDAVHRYADELG